jgi:23S rRNA pseudouridine2605 synthase
MSDPEGRPTVGDYVAERSQRLFHVGRLDAETEGLLLLTNDGDLAHRLTHPSFEVPKTYLAEVLGPIPRLCGRQLREGVELEDGLIKVDSFAVVDVGGGPCGRRACSPRGSQPSRPPAARCGLTIRCRGWSGPRSVRSSSGHQRQGTVRKLTQHEIGELHALVTEPA